MDSRDVLALSLRGLHFGDNFIEMQRRGVDHLRPFWCGSDDIGRDQRSRVKADLACFD